MTSINNRNKNLRINCICSQKEEQEISGSSFHMG